MTVTGFWQVQIRATAHKRHDGPHEECILYSVHAFTDRMLDRPEFLRYEVEFVQEDLVRMGARVEDIVWTGERAWITVEEEQ